MEHVYKTIRTQQQILIREREKIKAIKAKIGTKAAPSQQKIVYSYSNAGNLYEFIVTMHINCPPQYQQNNY